MNILVLCIGNSARSIQLEALLNDLGGGRLRGFSAGSQPAGEIHPQSLPLLAEKGHAVTGYQSKSWNEFAEPDAAPAAFADAYAILRHRAETFLAKPIETMDAAALTAHLTACSAIT